MPTPDLSFARALREWWKDGLEREGFLPTLKGFLAAAWEFLRDSTPQRRRSRWGDADYDWDYRVDTTRATVGWRARLLGVFHSGYQPTEPVLFHQMLRALAIHHPDFTFVDLGSGKGRALLMASDYPFRRILGVELLQELDRAARENIRRYRSDAQRCFALASIRGDARDFVFPPEPTVLYLFNALPERVLTAVMANLERSLQRHPRAVYVLYHHPLLERVLLRTTTWERIGGTHQYAVFSNVK
ncbi:MAG: class I SAM-dependent methyltransferase [Terriglobia bacterium]